MPPMPRSEGNTACRRPGRQIHRGLFRADGACLRQFASVLPEMPVAAGKRAQGPVDFHVMPKDLLFDAITPTAALNPVPALLYISIAVFE